MPLNPPGAILWGIRKKLNAKAVKKVPVSKNR